METQTQSADIPKWSALLVEAVNKPGLIMDAYSAFWNYSVGNQILALVQCQLRGIQPGPINTFPKWQALGRVVKRGERALILCMPLTRKRRNDESTDNDQLHEEQTPRNLREVEAEAVALLCCEALGLDGVDYARGYIQNWLYQGIGYDAEAIPEKSAQKIFRAADQILRAGRPTKERRAAEYAN